MFFCSILHYNRELFKSGTIFHRTHADAFAEKSGKITLVIIIQFHRDFEYAHISIFQKAFRMFYFYMVRKVENSPSGISFENMSQPRVTVRRFRRERIHVGDVRIRIMQEHKKILHPVGRV